MPPTIHEIRGIEKSKGEQPGIRRKFLIRAAADEEEAITTLYGALTAVYGGLFLAGGNVAEIGGGVWHGFANYSAAGERQSNKPLTPDDAEQWEFVTEGSTQRITQSLETVGYYNQLGSQPVSANPFKGAIGVGQDGHIEGVDIEMPGARLRSRKVITAAQATQTFLNHLMKSRGSVNNAPFRGWAAGEVKFLVGSTQTRANGDVELTKEFDVSPNLTDIVVPGISGTVTKEGWDYLWIRYEDWEDTVNKKIVRIPISVQVERVYRRIDFATLSP